MRFLRFYDSTSAVRLGQRIDQSVYPLAETSVIDLMQPGTSPHRGNPIPAAGLRLDAPIRDPGKLLALAGNYREHIVESGLDDPTKQGVLTPQFFWKPSTTINAPGGTVSIRSNNVFVDWEIELAVIIGKQVRNVKAADALSYVFGYTVINDISERRYNAGIEHRHERNFDPFFDWLMGKWFDGFAPLGPEIVTADEVPDPHNLPIKLWLNGELMQDSNTSCMIFRVPETIEWISSVVTLEPGDVIATGTPEGVGFARGTQLKPGDRLRGEIEGLGVLENTVIAG
jgi:2-keto-4-pentenoate hydratase/2-oxohepta-3-ene-1,7-dioic acid hydratase in catechol pathway